MERYSQQKLKSLAIDIAVASGVPRGCRNAGGFAGGSGFGRNVYAWVIALAIYMRRGSSKGVIDPLGALKFDRQRAGTLAVDAGNGLGQVQASKVLDRLIPMARECGIAAATIRNSQHFRQPVITATARPRRA